MENGCMCKSIHAADANLTRLQLPADEGLLGVARMTTASMASYSGLDVESVEDLKVAVEEACHLLLHQSKRCMQLVFVYQRLERGFEVTVQGLRTVPCENECGDMADQHVSRGIFEALVDRVEFNRDGCGIHTLKLFKQYA